jgi:hypothetical protein
VEPSSVRREATEVLALLSRAVAAFGDRAAVAPPEFATDRHLEDDVGCGHF